MSGHNNGYIQEDVSYDDLMNNAGWPSAGEQQQYSYSQPQSQPHQDPYARYQTSQPQQYDHFPELSEPSYTQSPYTNSPYASQYQSSGNSDYVSGPYIDPSLQNSRAGYGGLSSSFSFQPNSTMAPSSTIAPQSLQYGLQQQQSANQQPLQNTTFQGSVDQQPYLQMPSETRSGHYNNSQISQMSRSVQPSTINPGQYLNMPTSFSGSGNSNINGNGQMQDPRRSVPVVLNSQMRPQEQQSYVRVTDQALLDNKESSSRPRLPHAPFLAWEDTPQRYELPKMAPIDFIQRKSRSGKDPLLGIDLSQFQIAPKRKRGRPPKEPGAPKAPYRGSGKILTSKVNHLRDESRNSPSTPATESESESEEESETDSESDYEEEMPVVDISMVRGPTRPSSTASAAAWDTIGIVWKDPHSSPHEDIIKDAIKNFGSFVSAQRAGLKQNQVNQEAAASVPEQVKLKNERDILLESLYQTINAAAVHGYMPIIENLGSHQQLVAALSTTMIDCSKADDYHGKLPNAILVLMTKFMNLTDELLKKVKFEAVSKRWKTKGDFDTSKHFAAIFANTTDARERAAKATKKEEDSKAKQQIEESRKAKGISPVVNPAKRSSEGEALNGGPAAKKFASNIGGTPTASAVKPLPVKKPLGNLFPGITTKPAPRPTVKKPEEKKPEPPHVSKLGALLASIGKAPEKPKAAPQPDRPPETPEEKARRERKESRRHLRVKFKPDDQLTEIRLFKHEQAEDEGRQDEMLKDAHDDRLEGMMHKKRVMEVDDEEEDYQPPDVDSEYLEPPAIDFTSLEKATRFGATYVTRGGKMPVETPQQKEQRQREAKELMVIYTDDKDIPPSPKEPARTEEPYQPGKQVKQPDAPWLVQRVYEIQQYGLEQASQIFLSRREEQMFREIRQNKARDFAKSLTPPTSTPSTASYLEKLKSLSVPPPRKENPIDKMDPVELQKLLATVASLKGKPYPPTEPPDWMSEEKKNEWWEGYYRDHPEKKAELDAKFNQQMQSFPQFPPVQHAAPHPQYQQQAPAIQNPFAPPQYNVPQAPEVTAQVQNYLANYHMSNQAPVPPPSTQLPGGFDYATYAAQVAAAQAAAASAQGHQQPQQYEPPDRWANEGMDYEPAEAYNPSSNSNNNSGSERGRSKKKRGRNGGNDRGNQNPNYEGKNPTDNSNLFDENGEYKGRKKPCTFFEQGKCTKGDRCTFLH